MAVLSEIPLIDEPRQVFSMAINGLKVTVTLDYNSVTARFSLSLAIDETPVLTGLRMVTNVDFLGPYDFGIGMLFVAGVREVDAEPTLEAFALNRVKLYSYV